MKKTVFLGLLAIMLVLTGCIFIGDDYRDYYEFGIKGINTFGVIALGAEFPHSTVYTGNKADQVLSIVNANSMVTMYDFHYRGTYNELVDWVTLSSLPPGIATSARNTTVAYWYVTDGGATNLAVYAYKSP